MYSANSSVCKAAVHHGWIRDELGGAVTVRKYPTNLDRTTYTTTRNGVTALWYNGRDGTSFYFLHGCDSVMTASSRSREFYSNSPFDKNSECKLHIIGNPGGMIAPKFKFSLSDEDELEVNSGPNKGYFVGKYTNTARYYFGIPDVHEAFFDLTTGSQDTGQYLWVTWNTTDIKPHCPFGWRAWGDSCYYFGRSDVPYETAVSACHNMAAHVVEINSEAEQEILRVITSAKDGDKYWVGLRFSQSNSWYNWWHQVPLAAQSSWWSDGTNRTAAFGSDTCVIMGRTAGFQWTTQHCGLEARVLCEIEGLVCGTIFSISRTVYADARPWVELDFGREIYVAAIETSGDVTTNCYTKAYSLQTSTDGVVYNNHGNSSEPCARVKVYQANTDPRTVVRTFIQPRVSSRYLRVLPVAWFGRPSLTLGVLGCESALIAARHTGTVLGVFNMGPELSFPAARHHCTKFHSRMASPSELRAAFEAGESIFRHGWLTDQTHRYILERLSPASNYHYTGIINWGVRPSSSLRRVWCMQPMSERLGCSTPLVTRQPCAWDDVTPHECELHGCCWDPYPGYPACFRKTAGTNIALGKRTRQSTTLDANSHSWHGNDGVRTTEGCNEGNGTCVRTDNVTSPDHWWYVDLDRQWAIDRVTVVKPVSVNINAFFIHIGDNGQSVSANPQCGQNHSIAANQSELTIPCGGMRGRYVGIRLTQLGEPRRLEFSEFEVYPVSDEANIGGINVAALSNGGQCVNASQNVTSCGGIIDGQLTPRPGQLGWLSSQGVGSWVQLKFDGYYFINRAKIAQSTWVTGQIRTIRLTFDDGSYKDVELRQREGSDQYDVTQIYYDEFLFDTTKTDSVKMTVLTTYTASTSGFIEAQFITAYPEEFELIPALARFRQHIERRSRMPVLAEASNLSLADCAIRCLEEPTFFCQSFQYEAGIRHCEMFGWAAPKDGVERLVVDSSVSYFERNFETYLLIEWTPRMTCSCMYANSASRVPQICPCLAQHPRYHWLHTAEGTLRNGETSQCLELLPNNAIVTTDCSPIRESIFFAVKEDALSWRVLGREVCFDNIDGRIELVNCYAGRKVLRKLPLHEVTELLTMSTPCDAREDPTTNVTGILLAEVGPGTVSAHWNLSEYACESSTVLVAQTNLRTSLTTSWNVYWDTDFLMFTNLGLEVPYLLEVYLMTSRSHIYLSYSRRIMLRGNDVQIQNLTVSMVTEESFYVTWNVTSSLVMGYQVTYHLMGSENIDELYVHYPEVHLRGLLPGVEYNVSARAITTAFEGSSSSLQQYTVVDSPRDFRAVTVTDRSATLVWAAPDGEVVAYLLELIPVHAPSEAANTSLSNSLTTSDLTGLAPLQPYVARLYAVGHAGVSGGVSVPWITG
ncbi:uncharacterized protein LOC144883903 [Branchiostoma floridae x Branchiostoma japonicum]